MVNKGESVWRKPGQEAPGGMVCERSDRDMLERKFEDVIIDEVMKALKINWQDARIVKALLESVMHDTINDCLQAYLNGNVEIMAKEMNQELGLKEEACYSYAPHAKLYNHIRVIKNLLAPKEPKT